MPKPLLATALARALLAGGYDIGSILASVRQTIGRRGLPAISRRYLEAFAGRPYPRQREVVEFLLRDEGFRRLQRRSQEKIPFRQLLAGPLPMRPIPAAAGWKIPQITSTAELAQWLRLTPEELEWFAGRPGFARKAVTSPLHHYYYNAVPKRNGQIRLIEAPKQRLKLLQRQILAEILDYIPAHDAAHGFVHGRSIRSFAAPHVASSVVLHMDIEDFFPSIPAARIGALFRTAGYPETVAELLAGLCCNAIPHQIWKQAIWKQPMFRADTGATKEMRSLYERLHLPQGAPTSPSLANLCAYRLDCRLQGLAAKAHATYTRYADDLAFSGGKDFARVVDRSAGRDRFADRVGAILLEEGFRAHYRKTRIQHQGVRQRLAGLVVNQHLNIAREEFDQLKAILTNCIRHGLASQNRQAHSDFRAHLEGCIGFVDSIHASKGAKLRKLFGQISW